MGNIVPCWNSTTISLEPQRSTEMSGRMRSRNSEAERFDNLVKAIELPPKPNGSYIHFKYTWLPSVDSVVLTAQSTVNHLHEIRNSVISNIELLTKRTNFWTVPGANTTHGIVALIYSILSQVEGKQVENLIHFQERFPFFRLDSRWVSDTVLDDIHLLNKYLDALEKAYNDTPRIIEEWYELSKQAASLKETAKEDMMRQDKFALKSTKEALIHNVDMLRKIKRLAKNTMKIVTKTWKELEFAHYIIKEEFDSLPQFGQELSKKAIKDPKECYLSLGKSIPKPSTPKSKQINYFPYDESTASEDTFSRSDVSNEEVMVRSE